MAGLAATASLANWSALKREKSRKRNSMTTRYSYEVSDKVEARIPKEILEVLHKNGWNSLGIYEIVKEELAKEKKKLAKEKKNVGLGNDHQDESRSRSQSDS